MGNNFLRRTMLQTWPVWNFSMITLLLLQAPNCLAKPLDKTLDNSGWKTSMKRFLGIEQYYYGFFGEPGAEQEGSVQWRGGYLAYEAIAFYFMFMISMHFVITRRRRVNYERNDHLTLGQWGIILGLLECYGIYKPRMVFVSTIAEILVLLIQFLNLFCNKSSSQ